MANLQHLNLFITERLMLAVEEITEKIGNTMLELDEEASRIRKENYCLRQRLWKMQPNAEDPGQSVSLLQRECSFSLEPDTEPIGNHQHQEQLNILSDGRSSQRDPRLPGDESHPKAATTRAALRSVKSDYTEDSADYSDEFTDTMTPGCDFGDTTKREAMVNTDTLDSASHTMLPQDMDLHSALKSESNIDLRSSESGGRALFVNYPEYHDGFMKYIPLWSRGPVFEFTSAEELLSISQDDDCPYCRRRTSASEDHLMRRHLKFAVYFKHEGIEKFSIPCFCCQGRDPKRCHWHCCRCSKVLSRRFDFESHLKLHGLELLIKPSDPVQSVSVLQQDCSSSLEPEAEPIETQQDQNQNQRQHSRRRSDWAGNRGDLGTHGGENPTTADATGGGLPREHPGCLDPHNGRVKSTLSHLSNRPVFEFTSAEELLGIPQDDDCPYCRSKTSASEDHLMRRHLKFAVYFKHEGMEKFSIPCFCRQGRDPKRCHWHCCRCSKVLSRRFDFESHLKLHGQELLNKSSDPVQSVSVLPPDCNSGLEPEAEPIDTQRDQNQRQHSSTRSTRGHSKGDPERRGTEDQPTADHTGALINIDCENMDHTEDSSMTLGTTAPRWNLLPYDIDLQAGPVFEFTSAEELLSISQDDDCPYCRRRTSASEDHLMRRHLRFAVCFKHEGIEKFSIPCFCRQGRDPKRCHWHCCRCSKVLSRRFDFESHLKLHGLVLEEKTTGFLESKHTAGRGSGQKRKYLYAEDNPLEVASNIWRPEFTFPDAISEEKSICVDAVHGIHVTTRDAQGHGVPVHVCKSTVSQMCEVEECREFLQSAVQHGHPRECQHLERVTDCRSYTPARTLHAETLGHMAESGLISALQKLECEAIHAKAISEGVDSVWPVFWEEQEDTADVVYLSVWTDEQEDWCRFGRTFVSLDTQNGQLYCQCRSQCDRRCVHCNVAMWWIFQERRDMLRNMRCDENQAEKMSNSL